LPLLGGGGTVLVVGLEYGALPKQTEAPDLLVGKLGVDKLESGRQSSRKLAALPVELVIELDGFQAGKALGLFGILRIEALADLATAVICRNEVGRDQAAVPVDASAGFDVGVGRNVTLRCLWNSSV